MKLFKEYKIHSARFLSKLPPDHPCSKMHGHTFFVKLLLSGNPDPENDFIIDFYELDKIFEGHIFKVLDHSILNDIEGLESPTTENIAKWIYDKLKSILPIIDSVSVTEGENYGCIYEGEN